MLYRPLTYYPQTLLTHLLNTQIIVPGYSCTSSIQSHPALHTLSIISEYLANPFLFSPDLSISKSLSLGTRFTCLSIVSTNKGVELTNIDWLPLRIQASNTHMGKVGTIDILQVGKLRLSERLFQGRVPKKLANVECEQSESIHFFGTFILLGL